MIIQNLFDKLIKNVNNLGENWDFFFIGGGEGFSAYVHEGYGFKSPLYLRRLLYYYIQQTVYSNYLRSKC